MKEFNKLFLMSRWLWAGFICHIIAVAIGIAFLDFDILFSLAWANGIDGPTPFFDLLIWTLWITIPAGFACYCVAFWKAINGDRAQHAVPE